MSDSERMKSCRQDHTSTYTHNQKNIELISNKLIFQEMSRKKNLIQIFFFICTDLERWNLMCIIQIGVKYGSNHILNYMVRATYPPQSFRNLNIPSLPGTHFVQNGNYKTVWQICRCLHQSQNERARCNHIAGS